MDYFSGHTDQGELFDFLRLNTKEKLNNIFLGHGEEKHFLVLKEKLVGLDHKSVNFLFPEKNLNNRLGILFLLQSSNTFTILSSLYLDSTERKISHR